MMAPSQPPRRYQPTPYADECTKLAYEHKSEAERAAADHEHTNDCDRCGGGRFVFEAYRCARGACRSWHTGHSSTRRARRR